MRAADEAEFKAYAAGRMRDLRRTAFLLCGDWHHADDVVQTVFTKLYVNWDKVQRHDRLDGYVRTMLVRDTFDRRRRLSWRRELSSAEPPETPTVPTSSVEDRLMLFDALAKMPPRQRAVVVLRFWEDLDVTETAHLLGCTEGTVKSQSARGLAKLRELLAPEPAPAGLTRGQQR
ncbi:MAG TPA: SigE family RNA polymerase sigma factor [Acidothermaceae bacterium]|nr:SigE family RNA polymerase sigma factor [Acidothermaceae bacterium]